MMWASLLLAGILSGWWGPLAIGATSPAKPALPTAATGVDSVTTPHEEASPVFGRTLPVAPSTTRRYAKEPAEEEESSSTKEDPEDPKPPRYHRINGPRATSWRQSELFEDLYAETRSRTANREASSRRTEAMESGHAVDPGNRQWTTPTGLESAPEDQGPYAWMKTHPDAPIREVNPDRDPFPRQRPSGELAGVTPFSPDPSPGRQGTPRDYTYLDALIIENDRDWRTVTGSRQTRVTVPGSSMFTSENDDPTPLVTRNGENLDTVAGGLPHLDEPVTRREPFAPKGLGTLPDTFSTMYPTLAQSLLTRDPGHSSSQDPLIGTESSVERPRVPRSVHPRRPKVRTKAESPREQRRRCRDRGCRGRNWCPDMDVGNRAYIAPTVFEGKARSMSSFRKPGSNYAVTFEVKQVYKSQPGFLPLQKNDSVRLHFRDKAGPGKSTLCAQEAAAPQRDNSGVVRANIKRGKVYLVFVNRVGPRNFTILGEPVIRSKKNEQAVQAVVRPDYVREVTLSELRDSVARLRDRVKLVCRTRGSPPPRVHWLKDGVSLQPRRGLRIQHKRRRSKVVISSARVEDSGRYECVAESTSGHRASLAAQLLVAHDTRIPETTTAAWLRQEQPCPIAGDFCMNGGTCLFFETVGEPACRCAEGFTGLRCETKDVISTGSVYNRHRAPFSCKLGLSTSYYC
ncbi:uncharacterized protein LOC105696724 [Orussus abietinus]|uniref:uncharacterized protein LOC105696724 n=1 Tax=Orussus abietinus TaxID=222816 RepID=UPI00062641DA|nr:uncharacterized protein LOC105696724 [Orussus abietinus]